MSRRGHRQLFSTSVAWAHSGSPLAPSPLLANRQPQGDCLYVLYLDIFGSSRFARQVLRTFRLTHFSQRFYPVLFISVGVASRFCQKHVLLNLVPHLFSRNWLISHVRIFHALCFSFYYRGQNQNERLLFEYAGALEGAFLPHVPVAVSALIPAITFKFNEEVRSAAALALAKVSVDRSICQLQYIFKLLCAVLLKSTIVACAPLVAPIVVTGSSWVAVPTV